ncbi:MAG: FkbM family methyltransferase [Planctomycetota bacterium]|jgi:FkbM family methyltransferase
MKKAKLKGFTIHYNPDDKGIGNRLVYTKGEREPGFQWMIQKEARGVFYDIGANIGWITLLASKKCSDLHCFEPDKRSRKYLFMNCHQNRIADRVVINVSAVSDEDGDCRMLYHKKPNLSTTCTGDGSEVPCVRLDTYCINHSPPDAIKMDIEGAEVSAIYGAWETIKKH